MRCWKGPAIHATGSWGGCAQPPTGSSGSSLEKVAVNAVMAGAKPEYLPAILALAASGVTARSSSTTSFSALSVINGPYRDEIGMTPESAPWGRTTTPTPPLVVLISFS